MQITVASYNIRKSVGTDWRRRPDRVLEVLKEIDADIVALQEVDRRFGERISSLAPEDIVEGTNYHPVRFGARPKSLGWHGNTILARKEIDVLESQQIVLPAFEPRGAALADLQVEGIRLRIVGMHFGLIGLYRRRQAQAVLDHLEALEGTLPTVMMGDLNEWNTKTGCLLHFEEEHHVAIPGPSYHSAMPVMSFDRIITTKDITIETAGVHNSELARVTSDHLPVWAVLHISA